MREWEKQTWATGVSPESVIARVGHSIADRVESAFNRDTKVLILAGKGNNGADARALHERLRPFRECSIVRIEDPRSAFDRLDAELRSRPGLIVDGLFGMGLSRPLDHHWARIIEAVNQTPSVVWAIDVPSGLDCETGLPRPSAVRADVTWMVGAPKSALLTEKAGEYTGRLECLADIGLCPNFPIAATTELQWLEASDAAESWMSRRQELRVHKGVKGHLGIVAGSLGYHGAAVLACQAALKSRPGLVTVFTTADAYAAIASQTRQAMVRPWRRRSGGSAIRDLEGSITGWLVGPGLAGEDVGDDLREELIRLWSSTPSPVVADASALDHLWGRPVAAAGSAIRVVTPHPGEAARGLGVEAREIQWERAKSLRAISRRAGGAWVVLKGRLTLIGRENGPIAINPTGNPGLAQGGSGDVLAGFLAGMLCQPEWQRHLQQSVAPNPIHRAVWGHGAAADRLERVSRSWTVEDLIPELNR